jgi:hypothetical protein
MDKPQAKQLSQQPGAPPSVPSPEASYYELVPDVYQEHEAGMPADEKPRTPQPKQPRA